MRLLSSAAAVPLGPASGAIGTPNIRRLSIRSVPSIEVGVAEEQLLRHALRTKDDIRYLRRVGPPHRAHVVATRQEHLLSAAAEHERLKGHRGPASASQQQMGLPQRTRRQDACRPRDKLALQSKRPL